jgi:methylated-DNA-[protein]-cysteine S-methyltransferase
VNAGDLITLHQTCSLATTSLPRCPAQHINVPRPFNGGTTVTKTDPFESAIKAGRVLPEMNFNQKVWALTARVPRGKVTTYARIAQALGSKGYRAVGNALNRNPYAPAVPCHRVVGSDGSLTGFAGGLEKKWRLLAAEGVTCSENRASLTEPFTF